jgi:hypothetical protein
LQLQRGRNYARRRDVELAGCAVIHLLLAAFLTLSQVFPFPGPGSKPTQLLSINYRAGIADTTDQASYTSTTTWQPAARSLIVVAVAMGTTGDFPTISGHGLSWTSIDTSTAAGPTYVFQLWAADAGASPTNTAITITRTSSVATFGAIMEVEVLGADTGTSGVTSAIVQEQVGSGTTATTGSVTLSAASDARNRPLAFFFHLVNESTIPRAAWTELNDFNLATPGLGFQCQARTGAFDTTASATWTSGSLWRAFAIEVKQQ